MADVEDKQLLVASENDDFVRNDVDLSIESYAENRVSDEAIDTANKKAAVTVSHGDDMLTQADSELCDPVTNDSQSNSGDVANTVKVKRQRRKRAGVRELLASTDTETPVKRRRVQHNYRRLSSAGYVDDYDGRERFTAKQPTTSSKKRLTPSKSKSQSQTGPTTSLHSASRTTRSQTEFHSHRGQYVLKYFIRNICSVSCG